MIYQVTRSWDATLLDKYLWPVDRGRVLNVVVGSTSSVDKLIWHYTVNGVFSVRSCYHLIMGMELSTTQGAGPSNSINGTDGKAWRELWQLRIPPKVRMFVWRARRGILPAQAKLYRRKLSLTPFWPRCSSTPETFQHAILECRGLLYLWQCALLSA